LRQGSAPLHPAAWWLWAGSLAAAASRTTNPVLLALIIGAAAVVTAAKRTASPWARSYGMLLKFGLVVVAVRVAFEIVFGIRLPGRVLFTLPAVRLPSFVAGVQLGGPVTLESIIGAACQGLRLAAILACVGAVTSLVSPFRLLRCVPGVFYEIAVAVTVALSFTPALVMSVQTVRDAQRLRGRPATGLAGMHGIAVPVLAGALERSITLAASMDARGFGRRQAEGGRRRRATGALSLVGLVGLAIGIFGVLDSGAPALLGIPLLCVSALLVAVGITASSRSGRTRYRPDSFGIASVLTAAAGLTALAGVLAGGVIDPGSLQIQVHPLVLPHLSPLALAGVTVAAVVPLLCAPGPRLPGRRLPGRRLPGPRSPGSGPAELGAEADG
jgi:energy-coupling factor transport system permease protein